MDTQATEAPFVPSARKPTMLDSKHSDDDVGDRVKDIVKSSGGNCRVTAHSKEIAQAFPSLSTLLYAPTTGIDILDNQPTQSMVGFFSSQNESETGLSVVLVMCEESNSMKVTTCLCFNLDISSMREGSRWGSDGNGFWLSDALCSLLNLRPTTRIVLSFRGVVAVASQQGLLLIADSNQLQPPQDAVNDDTKMPLLGQLSAMVFTTDIPDWTYVETLGCDEGKRRCRWDPLPEDVAAMYEASPVRHLENFGNSPILFLIGERDLRVPMSSVMSFISALSARGVATKTFRFPLDCHPLSRPQTEYTCAVEAVEWIRKYAS